MATPSRAASKGEPNRASNSEEFSGTDLIGSLFGLADFSWRSFEHHSRSAWKLNFALWPALALFSGALLSGRIQFTHIVLLRILTGLACLLIACVYALVWSRNIYLRSQGDKMRAELYLMEIDRILGVTFSQRKLDPPRSYWNWSQGTQILITVVLLALVVCSAFVANR